MGKLSFHGFCRLIIEIRILFSFIRSPEPKEHKVCLQQSNCPWSVLRLCAIHMATYWVRILISWADPEVGQGVRTSPRFPRGCALQWPNFDGPTLVWVLQWQNYVGPPPPPPTENIPGSAHEYEIPANTRIQHEWLVYTRK